MTSTEDKLMRFLRRRAEIELTVEEDSMDVRGNVMVSGDDEADAAAELHVLEQLKSGNVWAWAHVTVTARWRAFQGLDTLGACSYASEAAFRRDGYFRDMKDRALQELAKEIRARARDLRELALLEMID